MYVVLRAAHHRPRMKVHGAWAMGYQLNVFLLDEPARHDSSAVIEMLAITIENVSQAYQVLFWVWFLIPM